MNPTFRLSAYQILREVLWRTPRRWFERIHARARFILWDIGNSPFKLPDLHLSCFYNRLRRAGRRPTLLALPRRPINYRYSLTKTLFAKGWRITDDPHAKFDVALLWEDETTISPPEAIDKLLRGRTVRVINGRCLDIRKSRVARVFEETFGYGMEVDPTRHHGLCVSKPEINARHGGCVIKTPVASPDPALVYHRLVNNVVDTNTILDLRTHIEDGSAHMVVRKYRHVDVRFAGSPNLRVEMSSPTAEFSADELAGIARFCREIGIDHGTLDVLRDVDDGRIYIVDANKTPWGPPNGLPPRDYRMAWRAMANAFEHAYLQEKPGRGLPVDRA